MLFRSVIEIPGDIAKQAYSVMHISVTFDGAQKAEYVINAGDEKISSMAFISDRQGEHMVNIYLDGMLITTFSVVFEETA